MPMRTLKLFLLALGFASCAAPLALAQDCPQETATGLSIASQPRTLEGVLIYHDGIRKWFELKLDEAQCGQGSIQLVRLVDDWTPLEVLRGCKVRSSGVIASSLTGYYSLDMNQAVDQIEPAGSCIRQLPFPDYSKVKPDNSVQAYRVDMDVNYRPGEHPVIFRVSSGSKELQPWQAYASYTLTGGFVLYGRCAGGFVVDKVFGTPQANPSHFNEPRTVNDMAAFDPESAADSGIQDMHLGYSCVREQ